MKNKNDATWNRISNDFDKRSISQPKTQQTNQLWITEDSWKQLNFIFYIQWKKTVKNITRWHKTLSASAISKLVSICCINFPHELTSQILTNQNIKIGRRAWPTGDHGESKVIAFLAEFSRPRSVWNQTFIIAALAWLINTTYFLCI